MKHERILVGIASYRDTELTKTIHSCLENAKYRERVWFAIVNQYDNKTKLVLDKETQQRARVVEMDYRTSSGVGYARRLMTDLWVDEEFVLQIDAHSRFKKDWDETLINEWQACNDTRAVLSGHPMGYYYDEDGTEVLQKTQLISKMRLEKFNKDIPVFKGELRPASSEKPEATIGIAGGMVFSRGDMFGIPYVREACFMGEEFIRAFQLYSHGFNLYAPKNNPIRHLYRREANKFWGDMPERGEKEKYDLMTAKSYKFVRDVLASKTVGIRYFGKTRTLKQYSEMAGLDLKDFGQNTDPKEEFSKIYRGKLWGAGESVSGPGSTIKATDKIVKELERLVQKYEIKSVLDIPCGDYNWIRRVKFGDTVKYIGADIVEELIEENLKKYRGVDFRVMNVVRDELPKTDLVIIRDCLVHFPLEMIQDTLKNVKRSGAKYMLVTTFPGRNNREIELGEWRPIDIQGEKIRFDKDNEGVELISMINEGCTEGGGKYADKSLGLFRLY